MGLRPRPAAKIISVGQARAKTIAKDRAAAAEGKAKAGGGGGESRGSKNKQR